MSTLRSEVLIRRVSKEPSDAELQKIVDVYVEAFSAYPFMGYLVCGHNGLIKSPSLLPEYMRASVRAGLLGGQVFVAELPDAEIVGAAIWFGPGEAFLSTDEQRDAGFGQLMDKLYDLEPDMKDWYTNYFTPMLRASEESIMPSPSTRFNTWYLLDLAVSKNYQRRGIGRLLIKDCERLAANGPDVKPENLFMSLVTETPEGVTFYKSLGFEVKVESVVDAPRYIGGSAKMWRLVKAIDCEVRTW